MSSPTARVFLVRHGATILSAEDRFAGATDVPLSDEGREQTRRLAKRLGTEKISAVYASPLGRTMETARILAEPHGLEVQPRDGLREISHGHWEQMTRREVEKKFPEECAEWEKDPYTFAPEGGESGLAVTARALPVLIDLVRAASNVLHSCRFTQGDDSSAPQLITRFRSTPLPRQPRSESSGTEHRRLQGSNARSPNVVQ